VTEKTGVIEGLDLPEKVEHTREGVMLGITLIIMSIHTTQAYN